MQKMTCKCGCTQTKMVRTADVKRGWGKFFSKSCKAKYQERKTGQYKKMTDRKSKCIQDEHVLYKLNALREAHASGDVSEQYFADCILNEYMQYASDNELNESAHLQALEDSESGWDGHK